MAQTLTGGHSLESLFLTQDCRRGRVSSTDSSGGNYDWLDFSPGETRDFARLEGCGIIRHIWCTAESMADPLYLRKLVLRIFWDGEAEPSVEVPLGDFFGMGHGICKNFNAAPLTMSPQDGKGFNCYFPMPYRRSARFSLQNDCHGNVSFYFYVDYESCASLPENAVYFHSQWRREKTRGWANPAVPVLSDTADAPGLPAWYPKAWTVSNTDGRDNYVLLEAQGRGHYVGCNLSIDCAERQANDWYGEGDDMIFIDGEELPSIRGTGTEDYFGTAFGPHEEFCSPYQGITLCSGTEEWPWKGKNALYRYHIPDPIYFQHSIRVTLEHGHANKLSNDYASTAYWYQTEPHARFPSLPSVERRLPALEASPGAPPEKADKSAPGLTPDDPERKPER